MLAPLGKPSLGVSGDPATQEYTFVWGQIISGYMFAHFDFTFCNRVFYSPV